MWGEPVTQFRCVWYSLDAGIPHTSKGEAASWAQQEFPQWADLIRRALAWRQRQWGPNMQDGRATVSETRAFVTEMAERAFE